ncbi:hypothetical protein WJU23_08015 [Prosthecobacter sp. SYSU 5D2]|uniref:hypothetical protein n=1 Tax=Prosthecobacter sp. SYSU 5D2 TaxID=3134134 RepID=UPI0031FE6B9A
MKPCHALLPLLLLSATLNAADPELMLNMDGDLSFTGATPELSRTKLQTLVRQVNDHSIQTLVYSIGAGSDILYYPTQVASTWGWRETKYSSMPSWKTRIERCRAATDAGMDAPRIAGEQARALGMKFIPSYRMNDAHYCSDPLEYPLTGRFWMEHQDAIIGISPVAGNPMYQYLLNYAREDVRAYRLGVIMEACDRYADLMDGFELDFNRFQIFFPSGQAEQHAPLMTELVRQVRDRLKAISAREGRELRLIVRVPPALANCRWAGLEVARWCEERLVDVVIPAQVMTVSHDMPVDEFVQVAQPYGVQVYGSLYGRSGYQWPFSSVHDEGAYAQEVTRTPDAAQVLGAGMNQLHLGASGIQLYNFNFFNAGQDMMEGVTAGLLKPAIIQKGARRYQITQGYYLDKEDNYEYRKQIPAALLLGQTLRLKLLVGEDLSKAMPEPGYVGLRLGLHGANKAYEDVAMTVAVNGRQLHIGPAASLLQVTRGKRHGNGSHAPPTEAYVQWAVADRSLLRAGWNELEVTLTEGKPELPLQVVEAEIGVMP